MMKIYEIVEKLNGKDNITKVSGELGVSKDTVSSRLKDLGYHYNNKMKSYEYKGDLKDKAENDEIDFSALVPRKKPNVNQKKNIKKSEEKNEKKILYSDDDMKKVSNKNEFPLTNEEVNFIKELYKNNKTDISLSLEFASLPPKTTTKKHSLEISEKTFNDFERLSKKMKDKRFSKNDLMEIALIRLMRDLSKTTDVN